MPGLAGNCLSKAQIIVPMDVSTLHKCILVGLMYWYKDHISALDSFSCIDQSTLDPIYTWHRIPLVDGSSIKN